MSGASCCCDTYWVVVALRKSLISLCNREKLVSKTGNNRPHVAVEHRLDD
jgi:hypothetical protein